MINIYNIIYKFIDIIEKNLNFNIFFEKISKENNLSSIRNKVDRFIIFPCHNIIKNIYLFTNISNISNISNKGNIDDQLKKNLKLMFSNCEKNNIKIKLLSNNNLFENIYRDFKYVDIFIDDNL